jgi:hypothetical protein
VGAVDSAGEWRRNLAWPLNQAHRSELSEGAFMALVRWRRGLPNGATADVTDLASLHLAALGGRVALHGSEIAAAADKGIELIGTSRDFAFLAGQNNEPAPVRLPFDPVVASFERVLAPLRAVRQARRWASLMRLPGAVLAPEAHAVSTSGLMIEFARRSPVALSYWAPNALLREAQQLNVATGADIETLARDWADTFLREMNLHERIMPRARELLVYQGRDALKLADSTMAGLAKLRGFPRNIWSGSAGSFATRAVGLEVLRRGGQVRRFAHGGAVGLDDYSKVHAIVQMAATSDYVVNTSATLDLLRKTDIAQNFVRHRPQFHAGSGDPKFSGIVCRHAPRSGRPTVVYVGTTFPGPLVHVPPVPPEAVYLDWQIRLLDALIATGANVLCKPHPENIPAIGRQPLAELYPTIDAPFEKAIEVADVLVHDYCLSTTFFEAMCSNRPVVLLDLSQTRWQPSIASAVQARCRILDVRPDDRNLPQFDATELKDAVLSSQREADPWRFRKLLAGDFPDREVIHG